MPNRERTVPQIVETLARQQAEFVGKVEKRMDEMTRSRAEELLAIRSIRTSRPVANPPNITYTKDADAATAFSIRYRNDTIRDDTENPRYDGEVDPDNKKHQLESIAKSSPYIAKYDGNGNLQWPEEDCPKFWPDDQWTLIVEFIAEGGVPI